MSESQKTQCCERDDDFDGNCDIHSAPGVYRFGSKDLSHYDSCLQSETNGYCQRGHLFPH